MGTKGAIAALSFAVVLAGCGGGGGGQSGPAGIRVVAVFDPETRTVPGYADTLGVQLLPPGNVFLPPGTPTSASLTRAQPSFSFDDLPTSNEPYQLTMRAYTDGNVVGIAVKQVTIHPGERPSIDVSTNLQSTIAKIEVTGADFAGAAPEQMVATAKNAGNQVLFTGEGFSWGSSDPTVLSVDSNGVMTGHQRGYASVVAWVNNPVISGSKLVGSMGYVPTRVLMARVGGTVSGMRDVGGEWFWTYNDSASANDVAIDEQERIYLAIGQKVVRIDDLSGFGRVELDLGFTINAIDVDFDGNIYMLDTAGHRVVRVSDMLGSNILTFGSAGSGAGQFMNANSLTIGRDGAIYVTDTALDRIARFVGMSGSQWQTFGTTGSGAGQFNNPSDVDTDTDGYVYVMDAGNYRICRFFTINGGFWTSYGTQGTGVGQFGNNTTMSMDEDSFMYVHDPDNQRVIRISSIFGDYWLDYSLPAFSTPGRIEVPDF